MMYLASYKAFGNKRATLLDKVIAIFSFGKYSHSELVLDTGECVSISPREKELRKKKIDLGNGSWDLVPLDLPKAATVAVDNVAPYYLHKRYDYAGALTSVLRLCIQNEHKMFCSEFVATVLQPYYNLDRGCKYSPSRLHKELKKCSQKQ